MRVSSALVTGAQGFLGKQVVFTLRKLGCVVYSAARRDNAREGDLILDLGRDDLCAQLAALPALDAVVHLAAKVDFAASQLSDLHQINVVATRALAGFAGRRKIPFVFTSTATIAGCKTSTISGDSPVNANTLYAQSKLLAEEEIRASGACSAILRLGGVFGLQDPTHLGLNRAISSVVAGKQPQVVGSGDGRRNYIYVKDAAAAVAFALDREITGTHLVAGTNVNTINEMLNILCELFLDGAEPSRADGPPVADQIIQPSPVMPPTRSFFSAVEDIRNEVFVRTNA